MKIDESLGKSGVKVRTFSNNIAENRPKKTSQRFLPSHNNRGNRISLLLC